MTSKILKFFSENPNPSDKKVHAFAESLGMSEDKFEEEVYKVISSFAANGKYNEENKPSVPNDELKRGIEVEFEHTSDPKMSARIAKDHLAEFKDYYTRLDKMEAEAEREKKAAFILGFQKTAAQLLDINPMKPQKDLVTPEMDKGNRRIIEGVKTNKQHMEQVSSKKKPAEAQFKMAFVAGLARGAKAIGGLATGAGKALLGGAKTVGSGLLKAPGKVYNFASTMAGGALKAPGALLNAGAAAVPKGVANFAPSQALARYGDAYKGTFLGRAANMLAGRTGRLSHMAATRPMGKNFGVKQLQNVQSALGRAPAAVTGGDLAEAAAWHYIPGMIFGSGRK